MSCALQFEVLKEKRTMFSLLSKTQDKNQGETEDENKYVVMKGNCLLLRSTSKRSAGCTKTYVRLPVTGRNVVRTCKTLT